MALVYMTLICNRGLKKLHEKVPEKSIRCFLFVVPRLKRNPRCVNIICLRAKVVSFLTKDLVDKRTDWDLNHFPGNPGSRIGVQGSGNWKTGQDWGSHCRKIGT